LDEIAARLARWVAGEADDFVDLEDEEYWPLIARMAELAAMTMQAMHRADMNATLGIGELPDVPAA
jgi:hypothetical protein